MKTMQERKVKGRGRRMRVVGTFVQTCADSGFKGEEKRIILLKNVNEVNGKFSVDQIWMNYTMGFFIAGMDEIEQGDTVLFDARIRLCKEEENESGFDCSTLLYPTRIKILKRENDSRAA